MADPKPTSERLEALQARWESDKGSRVFLQLADEYRRLGREEDAVRILDEGLEANPGHVGARVARGRSLLALGRAQEATTDLERVIEADPTQMVAYRFLVEGYIQQGDADQARQRLSVYGLLNDADPDIEALDRKIRELERAERTGAWPMPIAGKEPGATDDAAPSDSVPPLSSLPPSSGEAEAAGAPEDAATESAPEEQPAVDEPFAAPIPPAAADPPQRTTEAVDPFPSLTLPEDRRRYESTLEDDLFGLPSSREEATPEPPAASTAREPSASEDLPEPARPADALSDPFDLGAPSEAAAPDLGALLSDEDGAVEPPVSAEPSAPAFTLDPEPEPEPFAEPEPGPEPEPVLKTESEPEPGPAPDVETRAQSVEAPRQTEPEPAGSQEPVQRSDEGQGTVTLGRLYLRQGHLDEAEASFREVLAREPDNAEARQGLGEVAARRSSGIVADELLAGYEPSRDGEGMTARKRYALRQYLERLRGGGADVH